MALYALNGKNPAVGNGSFVASGAAVIGDVIIGRDVYIGFGAVIRGDFGRITIGDGCAIEDGVIIHCATECRIGENVIVGHQAVVHNAIIGKWALVGMQSLVSNNAVMEDWSILAEKSYLPKNAAVPGGKIYAGIPAVETGELLERHRQMLTIGVEAYRGLCRHYLEGLSETGSG